MPQEQGGIVHCDLLELDVCMPFFIKVLFALLIVVVLAVVGLIATGNEHVLEAVRSTYAIGRTGPDIDNYHYFENREVAKSKKQRWKKADVQLTMSPSEELLLESYETVAFAVIQRGEVVYEKYWEEYSDTSLSNSFSMAKTITAMLVGCAIDEGKIGSVDDRASDYLDELKGSDREEVTIKQLLQMTSGIGFDERYKDAFGFMAQAYYGDELVERTFSYPKALEPGAEWEYLGGNTLLLSFIVERATGKSLSEYASKKLWKPLGANHPALWSYDESSGAEKAYCCFYSNALDFARLGQLLLCDGNWNGEQLIDPNYVEAMSTPAVLNSGSTVPFYGYQYWLDEIHGVEVEYMRGILGQYIFVIPSKEMVVVRLGHKRSDEKVGYSPKDVHELLGIAFGMVE